MRVGEGEWTYKPVAGWRTLPPGWRFREVGAVGTDRLARAHGPVMAVHRDQPNLGPLLSVLDHTGQRVARIGGAIAGLGPAEFIAPHGIAVDGRGDIYVGEVSWTQWPQLYPGRDRPAGLRSLHKLRQLRAGQGN